MAFATTLGGTEEAGPPDPPLGHHDDRKGRQQQELQRFLQYADHAAAAYALPRYRRILYADVKVVPVHFGATAKLKGQILGKELIGLLDLIQRFTREFRAWTTPPSPYVRTYLARFDERGVSPTFRLAAHAFLHIACDLPRAIAGSLTTNFPAPQPRSEVRSLFVRQSPLFGHVFTERARRGKFGLLARPLGRVKAAEILAYWLLSLRSVAWIHAEVLAEKTSADRASCE